MAPAINCSVARARVSIFEVNKPDLDLLHVSATVSLLEFRSVEADAYKNPMRRACNNLLTYLDVFVSRFPSK